MKHSVLRFWVISLLIFAMTLPLFACVGGDVTEETTASLGNGSESAEPETEVPTEPETETPTESESETEAPTEPETEAPLPSEISLPEAFGVVDIVYECDDGSVLYNYKNKTTGDFAAVTSYYKELGFRVYSDTDMGGNPATTLVGDGPMAHVYLHKDKKELNIVLSETAAPTLPPVTPDVTDGDYECSVMQMMDSVNVNGMGYVIQLKDGSYIVYDGAYTEQARPLVKYLQNNHRGEGKPLIRAWVLTHSHRDHFPTFRAVAQNMNHLVTVEYIIYSPLNHNVFKLGTDEGYLGSEGFMNDVALLEGAKLVYAHTGMEFTFCNLNMEVLMAPETLYKGETSRGNFNNTSVVTRLYDDSYKALFLGDIANKGSYYMRDVYDDYLKSDMCQVAHHGVEDVPLSFYETVQASILYYPCNVKLYDQTERHHYVRMTLEKRDYTKEILIAGCGRFKRAWGTTFEADAPLSIPNHPTKGSLT